MIDDDIDEQPQAENTPTDFNDLHMQQGLDAVRAQVSAAVDDCTVPVFPAPLSPTGNQIEGQNPQNEANLVSVKQTLSIESGGQNLGGNTGGQGGENDNIIPFESATLDLNKCLGRFCLVEGESKYWDSHRKKVIKKTAFIDMLGKALFNEWNSHRDRRLIDSDTVKKSTQEAEEQNANDLIERFVMLEGTLESWDKFRRERVKNTTIKENFSQGYELWLKSERRRMIYHKDLVFDPLQRTKEHQINMFEGLVVKPIMQGEKGAEYMLPSDEAFEQARGIFDLLYHLCERDHDIADWVIKWLAYPLQNQGAKMASACLFHGHIQGAGKSLFFDGIMRKIYDKYSVTLGQTALESDYNDWAEQKLYCVFEEIFNNQSKFKTMGLIKHMVTGNTIRIDKKFMSGWEESNHVNCVFLSNEVQPLPLEENDRRFLVSWPETKLPEEIYDAAIESANNPEAIRAWYTYLLQVPLAGFGTHTEPPMTDAKQRIITFGLPNWKTFFYEWRDGYTIYPYQPCKSDQLFTAYRQWCIKKNEKPLSMTKFMTLLSTITGVQKTKAGYLEGATRRQAMVVLVGEDPPKDSREKWLGLQIDNFENSIKGRDDVPNIL